MIQTADLLAKVDEIQAEQPTYRLGGKAMDGTCDCIGLVIGALARCGVQWSGIHGSNWAARNAMAFLLPIASQAALAAGDVVYKAKEPGTSGYALPSRYAGSTDKRDYYHVGIVRSVEPLQIIHCTTPGGMTTDTKLGKWAFHGRLTAVAWDGDTVPSETSDDSETTATATVAALPPAVVTSSNGRPVKLRAKPSRRCTLYWLVPHGATVTVLSEGETWWQVRHDGRTGYMMCSFLSRG